MDRDSKAVPRKDCQVNEYMMVSRFVRVHMISTTISPGGRDLMAFEQNELPFSASPVSAAAPGVARQEDGIIFSGAPGASGSY
jgi:Encapsulating protein for peroxidase.